MIVETSERRVLAIELLDISARIAPDVSRVEEIKASLRLLATTAGRAFSERVDGKGRVTVKPATDGEFKGLMPTLDPELFLAADPAEQERLKAAGMVRMAEMRSRGANAAVTVELAAR